MKTIFSIIALGLWSHSSLAVNPAPSIAVIGDSYTRAAWADTRLGRISPRPVLDYIRLAMSPRYADKMVPGENGELSSELTFEDFKRREFMARDKYSFVLSKQQPWSIRSRLKGIGLHSSFRNFAQLGGTFLNAKIQLDQLKAYYTNPTPSNKIPDVIFVNLNGLDFIAKKDNPALPNQIKDFMSELLKEKSWNVFFTIPVNSAPLFQNEEILALKPILSKQWSNRLRALISSAFGKTDLSNFIGKVLEDGLTCSEAYQILEISLYGGNTEAHTNRISTFQKLMINELEAYKNGMNGFSGKIGYGRVELPEQPEKLLALDCMHMNKDGQKYMADTLWPQFEAFLRELEL